MGKRKTSRREFLSGAGKTLAGASFANGPFLALLDAIAQGAIQKAHADAMGIVPRKWLDLKYDSAPPRWMYDLFLKFSEADNTNYLQGGNKQLATRYTETNGVYTGTQYAVSTIRGNRVPWLWRFNVPAANGGTRPMGDLLADLLHIRGIAAGNPGHGGAQSLHYSPLGALKTLSALSADLSRNPIPAVNVGAISFAFRSMAGKSVVNLTSGSLITELMTPFRSSTNISAIRGNEQLVQAYVDAARSALTTSAVARDPDAVVAREAVQGARDLMTRSFGNLTEVWTALRTKYLDLIDRAIHGTYAGINDKPIGASGTRDKTYRLGQSADVEAILTGDLRALIAPTTSIPSMANAFALAEFVLTNNLSDSVTLRMTGMANVKFGSIFIPWGLDEHFVGSMPSLLINSLMAFAHASCLLELVDRLKAAGMWNETVINTSSEFNRCPRTTGFGADHGFQGASVSIYSGCIAGPIVLGNIAQDATPAEYKGTWGHGAPVAELGNTQIDRGNVSASFAALLRAPSPVTARTSLLNVSGDRVTPTIPAGKIVV